MQTPLHFAFIASHLRETLNAGIYTRLGIAELLTFVTAIAKLSTFVTDVLKFRAFYNTP